MQIENSDTALEAVKGREIGIDLGTCNSVVSYLENGKINILRVKNEEIIPSAIFFENRNELLYGLIALRKGFQYPKSVARLFKRKLKDKTDKIKIEFKDRVSKTYIIDTNVFIDEPDILKCFQKYDEIVVSAKVIDELSYRMEQPETEFQAKVAINNIKELEERLIFESSDSSLLPEDLDTRNDDNLILSIAFKIKDKNPVLLTSDKEFQLKCKAYNISFQSLNDFKKDSINKRETIGITGEEASALFLRYLKDEASKAIGPVSNAVITVPANFNNVEIESTKRAAKKAGFEEVTILKEPTAAAIAYGLGVEQDKNILIYDFGGGTFDVSIIKVQTDKTLTEDQTDKIFRVINTGGDANLGGEDLTRELINFIYDELEESLGLDMYRLEDSGLSSEQYLYNETKIYEEAELSKIRLSQFKRTEISFPVLYTREEQRAWSLTVTRNEFENLVRDKTKKTLDALGKTLNGADLNAEDIDIVVLAGGTSLMPFIQERVRRYFGKSPNCEKNTATVIAQGAAIVASSKWDNAEGGIQEEIIIYEKTVADFGIELKGHRFDCLIPADTELPAIKEKNYSPVIERQKELRISVYRRSKQYQTETRIFNDGIDYIDKISISNLPPMNFQDTIRVSFELNKYDILNVNVKIISENKELIDTGEVSIEKASDN
ncbi:Hsp70 family protein [Desulfonema magnum]|uniref:Chaperone protein DnaK-like domain-containing protein n=1 Tax=Desulfonema magnum TaxID=45655 RepID=A0A975BT73_9BACT|nr:Hsp70 family protein [Desulfonema magnum]QTA90789.1 Chaperone protein DnaK-like domain-containing protein [Desulfonema magnum]